MPTFDLLAERWVPVVRGTGESEELSLLDVLAQAPSLRETRDPMPIVEFGLYRLLVALVMDIHGLTELVDLADLLAAGRFDEAKMERYFATWHDRFDLFHPEHPFLQTAGMNGSEGKPLAALLPAVPAGTNVLHFHHYHEGSFSVSPAVAARLLTTMAPFMTAGGRSLSPSINGAPPWYVLIRGDSLFETICLNCCAVPLPQASGAAPPAWRNDVPPSERRARSASLLEALTWRPRRVQLLLGEAATCAVTGQQYASTVRRMHFTRGASCDFTWIDPNVAYEIGADRTRPLRPREGRQLWQDTGPLALLRQQDYESARRRVKLRYERPALVGQFAELVRGGHLGRRAELRLVVYGMRTDLKKKVFEWHRESLSLPVPLMWRSALRAQAQQAMDEAESAAWSLHVAVELLHLSDAKKALAQGPLRELERAVQKAEKEVRSRRARTSGAARRLAASAERRLWSELRPHYDDLLRALAHLSEDAPDEAYEECRRRWRKQVRHTARQAVDEAIGDLDTDADALVRQVNARTWLRRRLWWLTASPDEKAALGGTTAQRTPERR